MDAADRYENNVASLMLSQLTPRQRQVACGLANGLTRRQIAEQLSTGRPISIRTIDSRIIAVARRLPDDDLPAARRVRNWARRQLLTNPQ